MAFQERDPLGPIWLQQQMRFDRRIADLRRWYESHSSDDRQRARELIERSVAESGELDALGLELRVASRLDVYDGDGELLEWVDAEFTPHTVLAAIRAWDNGEEFAPSTVQP